MGASWRSAAPTRCSGSARTTTRSSTSRGARPDDAAPGALKIFVDGGYRCAMRVIRDGAPRTSGVLFYTREELAALLLAAWRAGRDVVCHAIGNLGLETAVGAIEDAVRAMPEGRP